jgi:hypothetical protein
VDVKLGPLILRKDPSLRVFEKSLVRVISN